ncbi:MAG: hypothetical protein JSV97_05975 [candidate division WOR-3 bacterium]|nr:MAG: hypothetical protein JSV97_05975 [candidate division WOR-3 bacterium]
MKDCLACDLITGKLDLPGGRIYATNYWVVEHCIGPLEVGTLIVKPKRHCIQFWELDDEEIKELGPLLHKVSATIKTILSPDQVYICLWSHKDWKPGHIHFVLQPVWNHSRQKHQRPGPFLQVDMFTADEKPRREEVEAFAKRAREVMETL